MKLFKHQEQFLKMPRDLTNRKILVWGTGTGKSLTSLVWARMRTTKILVVCPKHLKTKWKRDIERYKLGDTQVITKEEMRRDWNILPLYEAIILDEAHWFANTKSQMTKSVLKYLKKHRIQYVLGLTATPYMSSPMNIYALGMIMGKGKEAEWTYPYFKYKYYVDIRMGSRVVPKIRSGIEDLLAEKIKEIGDVVDMSECVDLPPEGLQVEYFDMRPEQKKAIKELESPVAITRWTQTHQICGGHLKGDAYNPSKEIASDKTVRVLELVEQIPKTIIVCRYTGEMEMLKKKIIEEYPNKSVFMINGDVEHKQEVIDQANDTKECVILVSAQCSEGWEAKTFDTMIFYSYDFSLKNYVQLKGRIQRIDAIHPCTYISLVIKDSIDESVYENIVINKMDFQLAIYK
jgi:hypothetical protein